MEASCTVQTLRNSCKFFSESDKKKLAGAISKNHVSDPGPSWPYCFPSSYVLWTDLIYFVTYEPLLSVMGLTLCILTMKMEASVDSVDQDQTAQNMQSDL